MKDFVYHVPTKIYFGKDSLEHLGENLKRFGDRVLLIYGGGSIKKSGLYDKILAEIKKYQLELTELPGVDPNPRIQSVRKGTALCKEKKIQVVLAAGGGSCLDTGKFVAAGACVEFDPWEFFTRKAPLTEALPLVTIPTIAATGSEMDDGGVISNMETQEKLARFAPALQPKVSFLDPELTYSLPPAVTASTGMDAFCHAIEAYWNKESQPMCDMLAMGAMQLILRFIKRAYDDPNDLEARGAMIKASMIAGVAFSQTRTTGIHALSFPLTTEYHASHGTACSITLPAFIRLCREGAAEKLQALSAYLGYADAGALASAVEALMESMGMPTRLGQLGVREENLEHITKVGLGAAIIQLTPAVMNEQTVYALLKSIL